METFIIAVAILAALAIVGYVVYRLFTTDSAPSYRERFEPGLLSGRDQLKHEPETEPYRRKTDAELAAEVEANREVNEGGSTRFDKTLLD